MDSGIGFYDNFRELTLKQSERKEELLSFFGEEFRIWWFHGRPEVTHGYYNVDIVNFFNDRLEVVENLLELKSLFLTLSGLSRAINTETYYYGLYLLCKFVEDFELSNSLDTYMLENYQSFMELTEENLDGSHVKSSIPNIYNLKRRNDIKSSISRKKCIRDIIY